MARKAEKIKAVAMVSGGVDSSLACRILQEQGVEVEAVHFTGVFHAGRFDEYDSSAKRFADKFGIKLSTFKIEDDFVDILKNPRYGYGSNMNPCVDCRIYALKKAKEYMEKTGASFIATGEVLDQRPMSQRKNMMELVEKKSGLEGLLLRPLSAKLLNPTIPEEKGWVDGEKLYGLSGRSRKPQIAMARQYGIEDYPSPAGGCLLTDPQFAVRLKDLLKYETLTLEEIEFLKVGRHFWLSNNTKAIIGRNRDDNARILELVKGNDIILKLKDMPGPVTVVKGKPTEKEIELAGAITARYSKTKGHDSVKISQREGKTFSIKPAADDLITKCMI